jgi:hypothetical protein
VSKLFVVCFPVVCNGTLSRINVKVTFCLNLKKIKIFLIVSFVEEQNGSRTIIRGVDQDVFICSAIRTWIKYSTCYKKGKRFFKGCYDINLTVNYNISRYVGYHLAVSVQALTGPLGFRRFRLPEFIDSWYIKVVKFSALRTTRKNPCYLFLFNVVSAPRPCSGRKD